MRNKRRFIVIALIILLLSLISTVSVINKNQKAPLTIAKEMEYSQDGNLPIDISGAIIDEPELPQLSAGMIPIKLNGNFWEITTSSDSSWYSYANKKPAFIMLNEGVYQSEEYYRMPESKKLAYENVGTQIPIDDEDVLGSIYVWIPRYYVDENQNIKFIKNNFAIYGMPSIFDYNAVGTKFNQSGVWLEYKPDSDVEKNTIIKNMMMEENTYSFIANTKAQIFAEQYKDDAEKITGLTFNDGNKIMLKIINEKDKCIKVKATYNTNTKLVEIEIEENKNNILEIDNFNGSQIQPLNGKYYGTLGNTEDCWKIVDEKGNVFLTGVTDIKINNEIVRCSKVAIIGQDKSQTTVKQGLDYLCDNGYKDNVALLLMEGYYNTADVHSGYSANINAKYNGMSISVIADEPGDVQCTGADMGMVEINPSYGCSIDFYRIIFPTQIVGDGFHMNMDAKLKQYFNCVFLAPVGGWNGIADARINVYNCLFLGGTSNYYNANPITGYVENTASSTSTMSPRYGDKKACLYNVTADKEYNITSNEWRNMGIGYNPDGTKAHIGVYGGKFAWSMDENKIDVVYNTNTKQVEIKTLDNSKIVRGVNYDGSNMTIKNGMAYGILGNTESKYIVITENGESLRGKVTQIKMNNEILSYTKVAVIGAEKQLNTIKQGFDYLYDNGYKTNCAVLLMKGYYDTLDIHSGYSYNINAKYNGMDYSVIADEPGEVKCSGGDMGMVEINSSYTCALKFYGIIFTKFYGDGGGIHLNMDSKDNEYHNCVFIAPVGGWNGRVSNAKAYVYNSLFLGSSGACYNSNPITGYIENSASKDSVMSPRNGEKVSCLYNVTVDGKYNITSSGWENAGTGTNPDGTKAHIGVYGGKFAWRKNKYNVTAIYDVKTKEIELQSDGNSRLLYAIDSYGNEYPIINNKMYVELDNTKMTYILVDEDGVIVKCEVDSLKVNGETMNYSKVAIVGEDKSLKTVKQGLDYLVDNGYTQNIALLLGEGYYNTSDVHSGTSSNINAKYNGMSLSVIADKPGKVICTGADMGMTENNNSYGCEIRFYQIVFAEQIVGDGFHLNMDAKIKEYYNCVFLSPVGGWNGKVSNTAANMYNCLYVGGVSSYYYDNPITGHVENCACLSDKIEPRNGEKLTCLYNVTIDEFYNITSDGWQNTGTGTNPDGTQANIGVYGGKYAWGY